MDIQAVKKEIISEIENLHDEKMVWALAHFLHLDVTIPKWQKTELSNRLKAYKNNPSDVLSFNDSKTM
jgi:hypothetical protein